MVATICGPSATAFQCLTTWRFEFTWGGTLCLSDDGNPIFGTMAQGVAASLGYNGVGIARGSLCGKLLADHVTGR